MVSVCAKAVYDHSQEQTVKNLKILTDKHEVKIFGMGSQRRCVASVMRLLQVAQLQMAATDD
jgi:hypothetical protein